MARQPALNEEALVKLGSEKLARLVIDEAKCNAAFRKRVAAALAGTKGPAAVAALIDKRLAGLDRAKTSVTSSLRVVSFPTQPPGNHCLRLIAGGQISLAAALLPCFKHATISGPSWEPPSMAAACWLPQRSSEYLAQSRARYGS